MPNDRASSEMPAQNTDRELWRESPGDYYANSIHLTESGGIGINVGGRQMNRVDMDQEANYFAMCLLMPRDLMQKELDKLGELDLCDDAAITQLARKFGVSMGMMALRIHQIQKGKQ